VAVLKLVELLFKLSFT